MKIMKEILYHKYRKRLRLPLEMRRVNFRDYLESIPESHNLLVKLLRACFTSMSLLESPTLISIDHPTAGLYTCIHRKVSDFQEFI
jgi:hypothetical protein